MRRFADLLELRAAIGEFLGESDWMLISQDMINGFAELTNDRQWIHVDPERAKSSPIGTTVAHGHLTLSLIPHMLAGVFDIGGVISYLNYGCNKVRFITPVPSGSRIKTSIRLGAVEATAKGFLITCDTTVRLEGVDRPACVAEMVTMAIPE
jgi:acyl dehydratase